MRFYVIAALLMVGITISVGMDICVIDCSHGHTETADPVNCKNYYICYDYFYHSEFPFTCEGNKFFDIDSHSCLESGYHCTPECEKCSFDCARPVLGKIASKLECDLYFECDENKWVTCPPDNPYFDGNVCQKEKPDCCTCKSECTASDVANHAMVPDYRNCTDFYLCMDTGIPDHSTHGHCPVGNFDSIAGTCNEGAPCIQPCA